MLGVSKPAMHPFPMKYEGDHAAGSLASCGEVDFLTAMTRLKLMGWTTCLVEEMEDSNSSGNSSPDRISFGHHQLDKTFSPSISNRMQSIDGSLLPSAQCANLLAGSGLDFAPVSAHHLLAIGSIDLLKNSYQSSGMSFAFIPPHLPPANLRQSEPESMSIAPEFALPIALPTAGLLGPCQSSSCPPLRLKG